MNVFVMVKQKPREIPSQCNVQKALFYIIKMSQIIVTNFLTTTTHAIVKYTGNNIQDKNIRVAL